MLMLMVQLRRTANSWSFIKNLDCHRTFDCHNLAKTLHGTDRCDGREVLTIFVMFYAICSALSSSGPTPYAHVAKGTNGRCPSAAAFFSKKSAIPGLERPSTVFRNTDACSWRKGVSYPHRC